MTRGSSPASTARSRAATGTLDGLLQTDAAINPGNSGGRSSTGSAASSGSTRPASRLAEAENVSFAIAIDGALPVIERDPEPDPGDAGLARDRVQLGRLGSGGGAAGPRRLGPRRGRHDVYPGGPGEDADLAVGDVIVAADDIPIDSAGDLTTLLAKRKPGDELDLELIDSRGPRLVTVEVERRAAGSLP